VRFFQARGEKKGVNSGTHRWPGTEGRNCVAHTETNKILGVKVGDETRTQH
jgi:hypothetical protein